MNLKAMANQICRRLDLAWPNLHLEGFDWNGTEDDNDAVRLIEEELRTLLSNEEICDRCRKLYEAPR